MALNNNYQLRSKTVAAVLVLLCVVSFCNADGRLAVATNERELIAKLQSAPPEDKAIACKQLAICGSKLAVPELAKLLPDEQLSSWARIALEAIPGPEADEALLKATDSIHGLLLVGTINSIGVRKDAKAVDRLSTLLKEQDAEAAAASAVALGHIGDDAAAAALRKSLASTSGPVRSAVAEGCILCAERRMAEGKGDEATAIYDELRKADIPKQRKLEATRGAILARKADGVPLLVEQLRSPDNRTFHLGLIVARQLQGPETADALASELTSAPPERAALLVSALMDRGDAVLPHAVLTAAKSGDKRVRLSAIDMIGRRGDVSSMPTLLAIATENDENVANAALAALARLPGKSIDAEIVARLPNTVGKAAVALIATVGRRRIDATPYLVKALSNADASIRSAALYALGETVDQKDLPVLITEATKSRDAEETEIARRALKAAAIRMPDRDACAAAIAAVMPQASDPTKAKLIEIMGAVGGPKALAAIGDATKGDSSDELQDASSRVLGRWMTIDAAPVLLELAKNPAADKYRDRALRGYIRLARQFSMPDQERATICANALAASPKSNEQMLVMSVLERYPSVDTLKVAISAMKTSDLKPHATLAAMIIAQKLNAKGVDTSELLASAGLEPVKVEIVQAEYGTEGARKDVTQTLQQEVRQLPLITLKSPKYNDSFGGDPAPGAAKKLNVKYRIDGKVGEASFLENAVILLPTPK